MERTRPPFPTRSALRRAFLAAAAIAISSGAEAIVMGQETHTTPLPLPRGGDAAAAELAAARRAGTLQAYDLFLARHPDHALARTAHRERQLLSRRLRRRDRH